MLIAIHKYPSNEHYYPSLWAKYVQQHGGGVRWVDLTLPDALEQIRGADGVMWRFERVSHDGPAMRDVALGVLAPIQFYMDIPVFPDFLTAWHYDQKTSQYNLLKSVGAPIPRTWTFWSLEEATAWVMTAEYPLVYKTSHGASSRGVCKVDTPDEAMKIVALAFSRGVLYSDLVPMQQRSRPPEKRAAGLRSRTRAALRRAFGAAGAQRGDADRRPSPVARGYVYFQEYIPGNTFDTRVAIVGERAFACVRLNRENDFRASGSHRFNFDPAAVDPQCLRLAFDLARKLRLQSVAFDFIYKDGQPVITELSYLFTTGVLAEGENPGYWRSDLTWDANPVHPAEAHVIDFMRLIEQRRMRSRSPGAETGG